MFAFHRSCDPRFGPQRNERRYYEEFLCSALGIVRGDIVTRLSWNTPTLRSSPRPVSSEAGVGRGWMYESWIAPVQAASARPADRFRAAPRSAVRSAASASPWEALTAPPGVPRLASLIFGSAGGGVTLNPQLRPWDAIWSPRSQGKNGHTLPPLPTRDLSLYSDRALPTNSFGSL